jgi:hypothetical protein
MSEPTVFRGPVFLVGMPRSGTKLLRELLNRHPDVRIPGIETEFLPYLIAHAAQFGDLSRRENFHRLYRHLLNFPYFIYRRDEGRLVSEAAWRAACPSYDVAGLFEGLVRVDTDSTVGPSSVWGDKSPSYIQHLTSIKAIYPAARFIHIVRDVRDQCLSSRKAWGKDMLRAAERWGRGVLAARNAGQAMGRDYLEVRYEDLLDAPEATMRRLCDFIDVAFHEDMTRLARTAENLGDAAGETRVVASNKGKFMTAMNARTRLRVEELAFEAMQVFGYAFTEARGPGRLPGWERRIRQLLDAISLLRFEARKRGVLGALRFRLGYFLVTRWV